LDPYTYRAQRERECAEVSASVDKLTIGEEAGPGALPRAKLLGRVHLTDRACVQIAEIVEFPGGHVHRIKYAYYLFVDGEEIGGYERDPLHGDQAEHFHCTHRHQGHMPGGEPAPTVSFKEAVIHAWSWLSEHGHKPPRRRRRRRWRAD
jgi:hypothetical protein